MEEGTGYRSELTLTFGSPAAPAPPHLGDITDADDEHLRTLRRTVVEPVVTSLLTDDELEHLVVHRGVNGEPDDVWVVLTAVGEVFHGWLSWPPHPDPEGWWTPQQCAERLADHLEDWIAESGFGWGQQRIARYVLPSS